jgi:hypothetical protein
VLGGGAARGEETSVVLLVCGSGFWMKNIQKAGFSSCVEKCEEGHREGKSHTESEKRPPRSSCLVPCPSPLLPS